MILDEILAGREEEKSNKTKLHNYKMGNYIFPLYLIITKVNKINVEYLNREIAAIKDTTYMEYRYGIFFVLYFSCLMKKIESK